MFVFQFRCVSRYNCGWPTHSTYSLRHTDFMSVLNHLIHTLCLTVCVIVLYLLQWELSVESFCEEDSAVKDRLYDCCRQTVSDRLNCFQKDAPNPNYEATEELPVLPLPSTAEFSFDPNTCQRYAGNFTTKS